MFLLWDLYAKHSAPNQPSDQTRWAICRLRKQYSDSQGLPSLSGINRDMAAKRNVRLHQSNKVPNLHGEVMEFSCWDVLLGCRPSIMEAGQRQSKRHSSCSTSVRPRQFLHELFVIYSNDLISKSKI